MLTLLYKPRVWLMAALATELLLAMPQTVMAASCCICTHPQIKNGQFCVKDTKASCDSLSSSANQDLASASCLDDTSANPCKKVPAGKCLNEPSGEIDFKLSSVPGYAAAVSAVGQQPKTLNLKLNIDVPGLTLLAPYKDSGEVIVPMLAQYIQAMQKLLIGISLVAASIMLVYGGFLYIVSGTGAKVTEGKKIITDALIGLIIILGAYVILANLNPNLVTLSALHLTTINTDRFSFISSSQYSDAASLLGASPTMPAASDVLAETKKQAAAKGIDPCIAWAIMMAESAGKLIIGHDENWYAGKVNPIPQSRVDFLRSRKFYSGKDFPSDVPIMPGNCTGAARDECDRVASYKPTGSGDIVTNDDVPKFDSPPDFGLDWRFSHGFGGGLTIFPYMPKCSNGWRGYPAGGQCFSVPQLVTTEGQVNAFLASSGFWKNGKVGGEPVKDPMSVFKAWAGCQDSASAANPCSKVQNLLNIKQRHYDTCKASGV